MPTGITAVTPARVNAADLSADRFKFHPPAGLGDRLQVLMLAAPPNACRMLSARRPVASGWAAAWPRPPERPPQERACRGRPRRRCCAGTPACRSSGSRTRAEDRLHAVADHHDAGRAHRPSAGRLIDPAQIIDLDAQTGDAGVEAGDVAAAAERSDEFSANLSPWRGAAARPLASFSTSRPGVIRLNLRMAKREDAVVDRRPDRARGSAPATALVRLARNEHDVVDQPVREREALLDAQATAQEIRRAPPGARG